MATYVVTNIDDEIINVIEWDGVEHWVPPTNCQVRAITAEDTFNG